MKPDSEQQSSEGPKLSWLDLAAEIYACVQIVAASLVLGLMISMMVYFLKPGRTRLIIGIAIMVASLITGILLATNVWKKKGLPFFGKGRKTGRENLK